MAGKSRRWVILGLGVAAQAASCMFVYGLPYLIPELRRAFGLSLGAASLLIACPMIGVVLALIAWGAAADRYGERLVIAGGLVAAAAALGAAAAVRGPVALGVLLAVAGIGGASVFAASGRLVLGAWLRSPLGAAALFAATALAVSTNGLAFTAVAEIAGMSWAGRALGVQNTAQNIAAAATPPVMAELIQLAGYPASFGITALFPVAAAVAIPVSAGPGLTAVPALPALRSAGPRWP